MNAIALSIILTILVAVLTVGAAWLDLWFFNQGVDAYIKRHTTTEKPDLPTGWVRAHWLAYLPGGGFALWARYR